MKYKVMIDYKNFIPIDEMELEKALRAMAADGKAFFNQGATDRIHAVLPDYHAIMGYNYGYELQPEDWAAIASSKECNHAKRLVADLKNQLAGRVTERPKEISDGVKQLARQMTKPTWDR